MHVLKFTFTLLFLLPFLVGAQIELVVLGTVQDGGSPHIGCDQACCTTLFFEPDDRRKVASLALIDQSNNQYWIFDATPDFSDQINIARSFCNETAPTLPAGVFLTHAHIGHYTGLMYLGREAKGAKRVPVYAMPKMKSFLEQNGPWSQLVQLENISINPIFPQLSVPLNDGVEVTPFIVPHRDEFSETVGYEIKGPNRTVLFIPDIDKWSKWSKGLVEVLSRVDLAFIDGTFYGPDELPNRSMSEIPHPFVVETMELLKDQPEQLKEKVHFIHLNHSNPILDDTSKEYQQVINLGFEIAKFNEVFTL